MYHGRTSTSNKNSQPSSSHMTWLVFGVRLHLTSSSQITLSIMEKIWTNYMIVKWVRQYFFLWQKFEKYCSSIDSSEFSIENNPCTTRPGRIFDPQTKHGIENHQTLGINRQGVFRFHAPILCFGDWIPKESELISGFPQHLADRQIKNIDCCVIGAGNLGVCWVAVWCHPGKYLRGI